MVTRRGGKTPTTGALHSFAPVINAESRVLILGSMPGVASLQQQQYYAHPRNAFWPIACAALETEVPVEYAQRLRTLLQGSLALWDVLQRCHRPGSLDADIVADSIEVNDFAALLLRHPRIQRICFNGQAAAKAYRRRVLPGLPAQQAAIETRILPSTSPAMARLNLQQKSEIWRPAITPHRH